MNNITLLTYSHSNCSDIHLMYLDSIEKYCNYIPHNILIDKPIRDSRVNEIIYENDSNYYEQMLLGLTKIDTEYLIYSQEDYILFNKIDEEKINQYILLMNSDKNILFIRLINAGLNGNEKEYNNEFVIIDKDNEYYFSTQITIWRRDILIEMFKLSKIKIIGDEPLNSPYLKKLNGIGLCTKLKGEKIGGHYNSVIYPYMATAILRGKWNYSEYGDKLKSLISEYKIDKNIRGII